MANQAPLGDAVAVSVSGGALKGVLDVGYGKGYCKSVEEAGGGGLG